MLKRSIEPSGLKHACEFSGLAAAGRLDRLLHEVEDVAFRREPADEHVTVRVRGWMSLISAYLIVSLLIGVVSFEHGQGARVA